MQAYGEIVTLSSRVARLVAPNPGPMTGHGTNTYLIGQQNMAVLDPGPAIEAHIDAILAAVGDRLRWIVCTHTHPDHSPGAAVLAARTGAQLVGRTTADDQHQDLTFQPDWLIEEGEVIVGDDWRLQAIRTPGHVDNHVCYLLEEEGMVFAGDHIMNGSTVVIIPPGGNMKHYIESLQKLLEYPVANIAPGHGEVIPDCRTEVEKLVRHRLLREAKVVAAMQRLGPADIETLVVAVYDDVSSALHPWAKLSLLAHLIKLEEEQRASIEEERWCLRH